MNRRGFLGSILALSAAPAIVRADSLMRIVPRDALVFHPVALSLDVGDTFSIAGITREFRVLSIHYSDPWGNEKETKVTFDRCGTLIDLT